jgi:hypothetical protein
VTLAPTRNPLAATARRPRVMAGVGRRRGTNQPLDRCLSGLPHIPCNGTESPQNGRIESH